MEKNYSSFSILILLAFALIVIQGCIVANNQYPKLAPGIWRGALELEAPILDADIDLLKDRDLVEKNAGVYLPFIFEVRYLEESDDMVVDIVNGEEKIRIDHITFGRDKSTAQDTFGIYFDVYDSYIRGISQEGIMQGKWVRRNRENYEIPFVAYYGKSERFGLAIKEPAADLSGKWACKFEIETDNPTPAIGEFTQTKNKVLGTFRTEIGDYRFLEGMIQEDKLSMSVFDGAHAFLFTAKLKKDSLLGTFYSGNHYKTLWSGKKNPNAELTSPDSLTHLLDNMDFDFSFENSEGGTKKLSDYAQPVKIIQIMGTWCPNCRDETKFLVDFMKSQDPNQVAVVALAYESYRDREKSIKAIQNYKDHFNMNYDILLAGYRDKAEASATLPMLDSIISFPTLIFLDRENQVKKIHTGYNGPATSKYEEFVLDFKQTVNELLTEI